jgi:hypothetical protein
MFVFIAGIGPRRKKLESQPRTCTNCGQSRAYLVRPDDYLYLFFIPIVPIRKGQPYVECDACGFVADDTGKACTPGKDAQLIRCPGCGAILAKDFRYCPYCGARL